MTWHPCPQYGTFFKFFEDEYEEHERTFDPAHMRDGLITEFIIIINIINMIKSRDFIDVYLAERRKAADDDLKESIGHSVEFMAPHIGSWDIIRRRE